MITQLYKDLMTLCETNEAFFFKDFPIDTGRVRGGAYRIFNYRLATYTDFLLPGALECRGITYRIDADGNMMYIVSRPMEKFFNAGENPSTIGLSYDNVEQIMMKEDGSLISTYLDVHGNLKLKTKGSLSSEQALDAMEWLASPGMGDIARALYYYARHNYTVNMEWVAPHNRIVIQYPRPALVVLNIRHNHTGEYVKPYEYTDALYDIAVKDYAPWEDCQYMPAGDQLVDFIHGRENFEGVVVRLGSGQHVKIKTKWYTVLHAAKDSIDNPKALIATVLSEGLDDLRSLFVDNTDALARMDMYEYVVATNFNHLMNMLTTFHKIQMNVPSTRKDYAINAKEFWEDQTEFFGVQMNMFVRPGQSVEDAVKAVMLKNYKNYVLPSDMKLTIEE